ncbi:hypothetical protein MNEG_13249 [Monoraphidium neglectum]|uniref:DNA-directed RNA polymerase III subunit RPC3 n=1 Tax=Monoraphidium neglectum TaxID=145388 RepID=A0A0D2LZB0_9CHLO|nr:hypothetical protein MNEG_13249 [Monoraphidium neglectum]KIY94711.1 hypothetical protein MNEG_13249 [Monoraphidium neglectum]|eukprot:XP_013893731.1 hypothetical protein MNEG_13249 [Monoraphidium neglectum]
MAHNSQHAHDLAKKIIKDFLGEPAEALFGVLLRLGRSPLPDISRACRLPPKLLRQALLVLLQHNFVRAYLQPEEAFVTGVRPAQHLYEPCTDWALQTLRRPAFLLTVKSEVTHHAAGLPPDPDLAQSVMSVLLDHGRLTCVV